MENEIKVSVIMPFYNGEEYIHDTLKCITGQTHKNIEIICIDDESTDKTYEILQEYERKDERFVILKQKKSNAGAARNIGLENATGEYLLFLDSDDLFELDFVERMLSACVEANADICVCNADQYNNETGEYIEKPQLRKKFIPKEQPFSLNTLGKHILYFTTSVPWNKLIRTSFVRENDIRFQEIARANDQYFSIMTLLLAKSIVTIDEKFIHYRINQRDNLTNNISQTPLCGYEALMYVKGELENRNLFDNSEIKCAFDNKILNLMLYNLHSQNTLEGYRELYVFLTNGGFEKLGLRDMGKEYFFDPAEYDNYKKMMAYKCEEYLLIKNVEYRNTIASKNIQIVKRNNTIKELKTKEKELNYIKGTKRYKAVAAATRTFNRLRGKKVEK